MECGGEIFQQVIGIPMGTNCAPLLADIFLYSYELLCPLTASTKYLPIMTIILTGFDFIIACGRCH